MEFKERVAFVMLLVSNIRETGGEGSTRVSCESIVVVSKVCRRQCGNQSDEDPTIQIYPLQTTVNIRAKFYPNLD